MQGPPDLHDCPEEYVVPLPCVMCVPQGFQVDCIECNLKQQIASTSQTGFLTLPNQLPVDISTFQQPATTLSYYDPLLLSPAPTPPDVPAHSQAFPMVPVAMPGGSTLQSRVPWSRNVLPVAEPRIQDATVSLWTSVPIDTLLMSELLASYFQQGYLISIPFQKDLFLEDLVSDRYQPAGYEVKHCSPLLVNAILAMAANTYTSGPLIAKGFKLASLSESFLTQAMHIWESEVPGEPKLTTIQAAQILSLYHATAMRNDIASDILSRAVAMAAQLELFTASDDEWTATGNLAYSHAQFALLESWVQDGLPSLIEDKDTHSLYEWGIKAQMKRQQLVELFHVKHGEIGAGNFRWLHPFLLGSLPGVRKTIASTQPSEYR
uniref:Xylanolytic transcriptional activator regulatory domain-containing protein n=1 Tax=Bionectria ochroleuca TaxID=29856 RepID=A0A8H7NKG0_BIOOC